MQLDDDEQKILSRLFHQLWLKRSRNELRRKYIDGKKISKQEVMRHSDVSPESDWSVTLALRGGGGGAFKS